MQNKIIITIVAILALVSGLFFFVGSNDKTSGNLSLDASNMMLAGSAYERAYSPVVGEINAPVTIVEFFDPSCEACRAFHPVVKKILGEFPGQVRLVLRYATFHQGSEEVVRMLEASRLQGVFESVLETLLNKQPEWAIHGSPRIDKAWAFAVQVGLNEEAARKAMFSDEINQILEQEKEDIKALKVSQTPTFYVNKKPLPKFGGQALYDLVQSEVKAAKNISDSKMKDWK
ncbi:MAG: protein-disulfide isomerase [Pseudohongiellaceae bacterium]|jgi:protein-disulfide isomerase